MYFLIQQTFIEKKCKKSKIAVWGGLTNSCEKMGSKKQRRKGKIFPSGTNILLGNCYHHWVYYYTSNPFSIDH